MKLITALSVIVFKKSAIIKCLTMGYLVDLRIYMNLTILQGIN
jgi:hypothetical protein